MLSSLISSLAIATLAALRLLPPPQPVLAPAVPSGSGPEAPPPRAGSRARLRLRLLGSPQPRHLRPQRRLPRRRRRSLRPRLRDLCRRLLPRRRSLRPRLGDLAPRRPQRALHVLDARLPTRRAAALSSAPRGACCFIRPPASFARRHIKLRGELRRPRAGPARLLHRQLRAREQEARALRPPRAPAGQCRTTVIKPCGGCSIHAAPAPPRAPAPRRRGRRRRRRRRGRGSAAAWRAPPGTRGGRRACP